MVNKSRNSLGISVAKQIAAHDRLMERYRNQKMTNKPIKTDKENLREAFYLLSLINAEFESDPMSVQCFDLRLVERVRAWIEANRNGE